MSRIYHSPLTGYIDLDKIARISDVRFSYEGRMIGYWATVRIDIQLLHEPIEISRTLKDDEGEYVREGDYFGLRLIDGTLINPEVDAYDPAKCLITVRLQQEVDQLVAAWKGES